MTDNTINNDMTMGGATGTLLAGRYRVVRQLGQGGMGSVWLAEDMKLDGFKVAIKMLPSVLVNNKRAYAQVKAEALVSLKLSHPNIVTVRAFEEEGGSPFLVMDYIDGQTLDDYLAEKGKLTEEETVKLLKPVAAALDYAHGQGVVHRDVKPGNVMIRKDGTPFVLDFGIAREIQETMTRVTGKLSSGTLLYMSPEQLNGDAPKPAQDIYSFAAMAYECLKGEPPFSRGGVEDQIKHKTPEALDEDITIRLPVMAGLGKTPETRPATCAAVLSVGPHVPRDRADAGTSARGTRIAAVLLGAFALVALIGVGGWFWREKSVSDELAAERARQVEIATREAARQKAEAERIAAEEAEERRKAKAEAERIEEEKRKVEAERIAEDKRKVEKAAIDEAKAAVAKKERELNAARDEIKKLKEEALRKRKEDAARAGRRDENSAAPKSVCSRSPQFSQAKYEEARKKVKQAVDDGFKKAFSMYNRDAATKKALDAFSSGEWEKGFEHARKANMKDAELQHCFGVAYAFGHGVEQDNAEAFKWFVKAAAQGISDAQYNTGVMLMAGRGVVADLYLGAAWLEEAASSGSCAAKAKMGEAYLNGWGVPVNVAKAFSLARESSEIVKSQVMLGDLYSSGRGVTKDECEAFGWYRKAAESGNGYAMNRIGEMYENGEGVPKSQENAKQCFLKAKKLGYEKEK